MVCCGAGRTCACFALRLRYELPGLVAKGTHCLVQKLVQGAVAWVRLAPWGATSAIPPPTAMCRAAAWFMQQCSRVTLLGFNTTDYNVTAHTQFTHNVRSGGDSCLLIPIATGAPLPSTLPQPSQGCCVGVAGRVRGAAGGLLAARGAARPPQPVSINSIPRANTDLCDKQIILQCSTAFFGRNHRLASQWCAPAAVCVSPCLVIASARLARCCCVWSLASCFAPISVRCGWRNKRAT